MWLTRKIFSYWVMSKKNNRFSKASLPFWNNFSLVTRTLEILLYPKSSDLECLFLDSLIDGEEALEGASPINWSSSSSFLWAGKAAKLRLLSFLDSWLFLRPVYQLVLYYFALVSVIHITSRMRLTFKVRYGKVTTSGCWSCIWLVVIARQVEWLVVLWMT